jgi:peptidoglycan/xylan/chitin deacetylase (PgdA/CDA1 family)
VSRQHLIGAALRGLSAARADRWLPRGAPAAGMVVTLHHVEPARNGPFRPNAHLSVTPDFLDRFLTRCKAKGRRFVPVDELVRNPEGGPARIAVTLDDGFRDNLRHAWPVFRKHQVPFTIYVCPGFSDADAELWWEALERIVAAAPSLPAPGESGERLPCGSPAEKQRAYRLWGDWLTSEVDEIEQRMAIRALAERHGLDLAALASELVMTWDEVREIAADPLCSIGAHTLTHPALARLSADAAFREMRESADRIAAELGARPTTIAFPYGHAQAATAREARLAEEAGFLASFTTRPGLVPRSGGRHGLPRISLNGLYQDARLFDALLAPGLWALRDRLRRRG